MMPRVYYNEIEPYAVAWLRNLMAEGLIPAGDIDTRSIEDVRPSDLAGYVQCHFFAGIGGWPLALALAGWPSDRPVWTGSCPCQPFSAAGKGAGFADERHLWPAWQHLIAQCRPAVVFGEQVASKNTDPWVDLVHADLEGMGYAFGCIPFPAAGIGAPHIRERNYWVADADHAGLEGRQLSAERATERLIGAGGVAGGLADANRGQLNGIAVMRGHECNGKDAGWAQGIGGAAPCGEALRTGSTNGFWRDADWLGCTDGKWRPVEPSTFPLADGAPARVGRLRAYGNAINAEAARVWIETVMDCMP
jgi:DNA (cytosine-5)-methyltransferase 1